MKVRNMGKICGMYRCEETSAERKSCVGKMRRGAREGKGVKIRAQNARGCRDNDSTTTGLQSVSQKSISPRARATKGERHTTTGTSPVAGTPAAKEACARRGNEHTKRQKVKPKSKRFARNASSPKFFLSSYPTSSATQRQ